MADGPVLCVCPGMTTQACVCHFLIFSGPVISSYGREYAADPYIGHSIGPVTGYGVSMPTFTYSTSSAAATKQLEVQPSTTHSHPTLPCPPERKK